MTKWEELEQYLFDRDLAGEWFNNAALAEDWGIDGGAATGYIQSYLGAQVRKNSTTLFVLQRSGRTRKAMWHVGVRSSDARHLGSQTVSDMKRRVERFVAPTLNRIGEQNSRALPAAQAVAKGIEAGIELLVSMLDGDEA